MIYLSIPLTIACLVLAYLWRKVVSKSQDLTAALTTANAEADRLTALVAAKDEQIANADIVTDDMVAQAEALQQKLAAIK